MLKQPGMRRLLLVLGCTLVYGMLLVLTKITSDAEQRQTILFRDWPDEGLRVSVILHCPTLQQGSSPQIELRILGYNPPSTIGTTYPDRLCIYGATTISMGVDNRLLMLDSLDVPALNSYCYDLRLDLSAEVGTGPSAPLLVPREGHASTLAPLGVQAQGTRFWYPFDSSSLRVGIRLYYTIHSGSDYLGSYESSSLASIEMPESSGWQVTLLPESSPMAELGNQFFRLPNFLVLRFERSIFERILFPLLIAVVYLFILLLCFVNQLGTFVEGAVAVFFGILGLNQVLLPANADILTIVDLAIYGLYFVFAGVVIYHLSSAMGQALKASRRGTGLPEDRVPDTMPPATEPNPPSVLPPPAHEPYPATKQRTAGLLLLGAAASALSWILLKPRRRQ